METFNGMTRIECVLIDWHETLSHSLFWEPWHVGTATERQTATFLQGAMFGAHRHLLEPWMRGELTSEDVVGQVARSVDVPFAVAMEGFVASCKAMRLVSDEVLPLIAELRSHGMLIGIATNNMDSFTRWTVPSLGLDRHVDAVINSAVIGTVKRQRGADGSSAFFGDFLRMHEFAPGATVMLDDSEDIADILEAAGIMFQHITQAHTVVDALAAIRADANEQGSISS